MRVPSARAKSPLDWSVYFSLAAGVGQSRALLLAGLGFLSIATYWLGLLLPYNLFTLGVEPGQSVATLTQGRPHTQLSFVLTTAALWSFYLLMWRLCRLPERHDGQPARAPWPLWAVVLGTALIAAVWLLWLYPIGSADVFDNIALGRISVVWGGNPFYQTISQFDDPLARYAGWPFATSAYGPLWVLVTAAASELAGANLLVNVLVYKFVALVFYAGSVVLIAGLLRRHAPERALSGTCLFALNPLVLYETAGNGHNDIVLVGCLLLMAAALARGRHTLAALALTAGVLVKYIPILLVPVLLAYSLRALPHRRARLRYLLVTGLACGLLALAAWAPFWQGGDVASVGRRTVLFTTSLPALLDLGLRGALGPALSRYLVSRAALVLIVIVAYIVSWHTWWRTAFAVSTPAGRQRSWLEPVRTGQMLLLFYLLVACLWFQPWYALWPLALAALLPETTVVYLAVLLAYTAGWKSIYLDFFISPYPLSVPASRVETWLAPAVLGFPWLYAALAVAAQLLRRRDRAPVPTARPPVPTVPLPSEK